MKDNHQHIDDLIGKYLSGEASGEEMSLVESWVSEDEANKKYFLQLQTIFQRSSDVKSQLFNTDAAWEKVKRRMNEDRGRSVSFDPTPEKTGRHFYLKIAASILVIFTIGYLFYSVSTSVKEKVDIVTEAQGTADTLPDGSDVYLNKSTQLSYSFDKKKKAHVVKLKGEAYFNIQHNDDKAFLVDVGGVFVKDIGTSFNVKAYPDSTTIEVVVEEGEVMFFTDTDSGLYLKKNGRGIYNKQTKTFIVAEPDPNITAYKTKFFSFADTDLASVAMTLNKIYDTPILLGKGIEKCRITVTFDQDTATEIAGIIAETLGLKVTKTPDGILLEGSPCESQ